MIDVLQRALDRWANNTMGFGDAGVIITEYERLCADENLTRGEAAAQLGVYLDGIERLEEIAMIEQFGRRTQ